MNLSSKIIIIRGAVGSGKTSVVESLRDTLGNISIIDFDAFKRQIDNTSSSVWRRTIALDTALYLCDRLMAQKRLIVVDIHSSHPEQYEGYVAMAKKYGYEVDSFMLHPPLETCIERASKRIVPDINYEIDTDMIKTYWDNAVFIEGEMVFRDSTASPDEIARAIVASVATR